MGALRGFRAAPLGIRPMSGRIRAAACALGTVRRDECADVSQRDVMREHFERSAISSKPTVESGPRVQQERR